MSKLRFILPLNFRLPCCPKFLHILLQGIVLTAVVKASYILPAQMMLLLVLSFAVATVCGFMWPLQLARLISLHVCPH